jgi:hypothetical protein
MSRVIRPVFRNQETVYQFAAHMSRAAGFAAAGTVTTAEINVEDYDSLSL